MRLKQLIVTFFSLSILSLVTQKKDIKKQKEKLDTMKREVEEEKARAKAAARERVLAEFERSQIGLAGISTVSTSGKDAGSDCIHLPFPLITAYLIQYMQLVARNANLHLTQVQLSKVRWRLRKLPHARLSVSMLMR